MIIALEPIKAWLRCMMDQPLRFILACLLAAGFGFWYGFPAGFAWLTFLLWFFYAWDDRPLAFFAMLLLAICPIFLAFHQEDYARGAAQGAFLVFAMVFALRFRGCLQPEPPEDPPVL